MPEIFLEFIGDASPWLVPLLVVLAVWGKLNWDALNNPAKKASFDRAVGWLREDSFGQLYLRFLGGLMDRVGDWIGDRQRLSQDSMAVGQPKGLVGRVFGFNPFTAKSYEKCLWLAFMYPVLAYWLAWAMGAEGEIGNVNLFYKKSSTLDFWHRWSFISGIVFCSAIIWLLSQWQGRKQWLALTLILMLTASINSWLGAEESIILLFIQLLATFLFLHILMYLGGLLPKFLRCYPNKPRHQEVYKLAVGFRLPA